MKPIIVDRCKGAFVGLAIGDALGTTNEFCRPEEVTPIDDIIGGGPFNLLPGEWTDDTSMALCLAQSIIDKQGVDLKDQLEKYTKWLKDGYMSSTGVCFDIGSATYKAINNFNDTGDFFSGDTNPDTSGNGSIMRLAPSIIPYVCDPEKAINSAIFQGLTTHGTVICKEACALMAHIMLECIHHDEDNSKEYILPFLAYLKYNEPDIQKIAMGDYLRKEKSAVFHHGGYAASSLNFAIWCFHNTESFKDCVLLAANAGGDSDTNAAIAGQIAGSYYGYSSIPYEWLEKLYMHDEIVDMTHKLIKMAY